MADERKLDEILDTLKLVRNEGEVIEIRMVGTREGTVSGYFDNYTEAVKSLEKYNGKNDIYITLNPVKSGLLSRYNNRLQTYAKQTTSDTDIEKIKYILIDLDPVRPSGISSTKEEKEKALELLKNILRDFKNENFPTPIAGDSGNGYHLLLPIDMENSGDNIKLVKDFLEAMDFIYSTEEVQVDRTTYNPARIVKFYGTIACKGDNTEERPHRYSKVIKKPKERTVATREQIQSIVSKRPKVESEYKVKASSKSINIDDLIEKHRLDLAYKAPFKDGGTKYILKTCPWNSDHTNSAAYIIQFDNGAIAAGCHHNGCKDENWKTLKELLKETSQEAEQPGRKEEKQSDVIIKLAKDFRYFKDELEQGFVAIDIDNHVEVMEIKSKKFALYLTKLYFEEKLSSPGSDAISQAVKVFEMKAIFSDNQQKLQRRLAKDGEDYYYDICDREWRAIKINKDGCSIESNPPTLFRRSNNMKQQVEPDFTTKPSELFGLVEKHFRFKGKLDKVLFTVYLVTCFIPQIAHVLSVLFGEKGAAKSTTMRMMKEIVDPSMEGTLTMPTSKHDLAIVLSNNYMPCFDNLDTISAEKSDLLCMAATGGAFSKRTLYSDSDETILRFKRCVSLNGINIVATRPDLLDRSILLELERIPKTERKTEKEIEEEFEKDLPKFLGAIFNAMSKAIPLYDEVKLDEVGRMADFTYWGYAIAEVLELGGDIFLESYLTNQDTANEEALASHPVAAAVNAMMKTTPSWTGSVSQLLRKLEDIAEYEKINTRVKSWARDANVLSRRLKEVKSNLEEVGIHYYKRHAGSHKEITIEKVGALNLTRPEEPEDTLVGEESSRTTLDCETSLEEVVNELLDV